jgi:hypothetical protein
LSWYALLQAEARTALRRPITVVCAFWFLISGMVFAIILGGTGSALAAATRGLVLGLQFAAAPAILIGTAIGGEDDDLGTKRDLWLADISPTNLLIAKCVVAVDVVVVLSLLMFVGGGLAGLFTALLSRTAGPAGTAGSGLGSAYAMMVLVLPFTVVTSGCTSAMFRSRFGGAVVWLGLFALHVGARALPDSLAPLAQVVRFLPLGSITALAIGHAFPGSVGSAMPWWLALTVSIGWLALFGLGAMWRWRSRARRGAGDESAKQSRLVHRRRHVLVVACLSLALALAGWLLPQTLTRLGLGHDAVYQALTHNRQQDYLERLAEMIEAGDYQAAEQYVGPAGSAGLAAVKSEIEHSDGDSRLMVGSTSDGEKTYPTLSLETPTVAADGTPMIVLGDDFLFYLDFERGSWHIVGIRKAE